MSNRKTTKHALVISAISLILCFVMLLGTTFAWFTDEVTSSKNIIKSGTLDVTMEWADGTEAVPVDDSADWKDAAEGAIFDYDLWEPGFVQVRHIKIANEGTLALKYQLGIVANGEVSDLSDVIDVYYVDPATQVTERTALTEDMKLGTLTEVLKNLADTAKGNLMAGDKETITLALKMQESAGNTYQTKSIGSDFSVKLYATQYTYEEDSFDNLYDEDAKNLVPDVVIPASTNTDAAKAKEENTAALNDAIAAADDADGNGVNVISLGAGEYKLNSADNKNIAIVGTTDTVIDMEDGVYMDSGVISLEGVTIKLGLGKVNGGKGSDYTALYSPNATFTNCTFEGGLRVGRNGAKFIGCTFNLGASDYVYSYGNNVEVTNCVFNTAGKAFIVFSDGNGDISEVSVTGCTFNATAKGYAGAIANQECAAIEIDNYGCGVNLTLADNTIGENFSGEWRIKSYYADKGNDVIVNGVEYTSLALDGKAMTIDSDRNVTVAE